MAIDKKSAEYKRGIVVVSAAINKFGLECSKTILEINHPQKLHRKITAESTKNFVARCRAGITEHEVSKGVS